MRLLRLIDDRYHPQGCLSNYHKNSIFISQGNTRVNTVKQASPYIQQPYEILSITVFQDTINKRYVSEQTYRMWPTLLFMEMYESNNFQQRNNIKSKYKQTILHKSSCDLYHVN